MDELVGLSRILGMSVLVPQPLLEQLGADAVLTKDPMVLRASSLSSSSSSSSSWSSSPSNGGRNKDAEEAERVWTVYVLSYSASFLFLFLDVFVSLSLYITTCLHSHTPPDLSLTIIPSPSINQSINRLSIDTILTFLIQ